MKSIILVAALIGISLLTLTFLVPGQALAQDDWTQGNGWCQDNICFRALPGDDYIEIAWKAKGPVPALRVVRQISGSVEEPIVIATSTSMSIQSGESQEFFYKDTAVLRGEVYSYTLTKADGSLLCADESMCGAIEAGLSTVLPDPGGPSYRTFLPLAMR